MFVKIKSTSHQHRARIMLVCLVLPLFIGCSSKVAVSVNRGNSAAESSSGDIKTGISASLSQRSLDKTKSTVVATAAGAAVASSSNAGASFQDQASAALKAALISINSEFAGSTSDISLASLATFEAVSSWLVFKNSTASVDDNIKTTTSAIITAIANQSSSSTNSLASLTGVFGNAQSITISGKTLTEYASAVMGAITVLMNSNSAVLELCKTATTLYTTSVISQSITSDTFSTAIAALFKGVTDAAAKLDSSTAAATSKTLLDQIASSASTTIANSSLSTASKAVDAAALKTAAALALDTLAAGNVITAADAATAKASINTKVDSVVTTSTSTTTTTAPEINIKQGTTSLASSSGSQSFGSVSSGGGTADLVFTVENLGTATLNLTGTPAVSISGTDASSFSVTVVPTSTVAASSIQTFTLRFAPATSGAKTATVTIANNDSDEGTYTFTVTGTGTVGPEINIKQGSTSLASGSGSQSFGSVAVGANGDLVFTVENTGNATLNLSGTPKAALSGADAADFSVTSQPAATVAASATTTFTVRFAPAASGPKTATVTVANDDSDEGTYTFTITGTATTSPEINIKQGVTSLASGSGSKSFGSVVAGSNADLVFTVENTGTATLNLSGTPKAAVSGTDAADFSVTAQPAATVAVAGTTTFTVRFAPSTGGSKTATITVANDDSDEGTYTFAVTGTATTAPEINIKQGSTSLASGSGSQSFGSAVANSGTADLTFTIENIGTATLNISGTPKAALSGANAAEFSVTAQPAATVAAAGTTTFTIRFAPTSVAAKTATVTVANDDSDEGTYTFAITGTGTAAPAVTNSQTGNPTTFNQTNSTPAYIQDWTNITNAASGDGAAMTTANLNDAKADSANLELTGFGLSSTLPSTGTVNGIKVEINKRATGMSNSATCRDSVVKLIIGGTASGSNLADSATDWSGSYTSAFYGDATNLWGLTPTMAQVRASNFGVSISGQVNLPSSTGTCVLDIEYVKITVYYTPNAYKIFTTSSSYDGNLGGLTGADAKCQASVGTLTGTYKAILSDGSNDAKDRLIFVPGVQIVNTLDQVLATDSTGLWDGLIDNPANYTDSTAPTMFDAWTGTNSNGTKATGFMCNSWTSSSNGFSGLAGVPSDTSTNTYWIAIGGATCDLMRALMCVLQ